LAIATRVSKAGRGSAPILVQAQALRDLPTRAPDGPQSGFAIIPDDALLHPVAAAGPTEDRSHDADVQRAIAAAQQAGLTSYRVEIAPDGTIAIIVGTPPDAG